MPHDILDDDTMIHLGTIPVKEVKSFQGRWKTLKTFNPHRLEAYGDVVSIKVAKWEYDAAVAVCEDIHVAKSLLNKKKKNSKKARKK